MLRQLATFCFRHRRLTVLLWLVAVVGISFAAGTAAEGDATRVLQVVQVVQEQSPDLVIMDVRMPPTHTDEGLRAAIELREARPATPVPVLSQYVEERYATELLAMGTVGVGYLLKERVADVRDFVEAAVRVADGGTALDPEVVSQLLARRRRRDPLDSLTPRERDVLSLMAQGLSNIAIASTLMVSAGRWRSTSRRSSPSSTCHPRNRNTAESSPSFVTSPASHPVSISSRSRP